MAMAPEQAPASGGPPAKEQGPGANVGKLIDSIHSGLSDLSGIFASAQIPDEFKQKLGSLQQGFESLIQEMNEGPSEGGGPKEASGAVPMEAGTNKNVQQAM